MGFPLQGDKVDVKPIEMGITRAHAEGVVLFEGAF